MARKKRSDKSKRALPADEKPEEVAQKEISFDPAPA